jgi:hypothetical protein
MTFAHTPGPWAVSAGSYGPEMQIIGADGFGVALCADGVGDGVMERNARLIAAAPDLLAQAQLAVTALQKAGVHPSYYAGLIEAIAKAGGAA